MLHQPIEEEYAAEWRLADFHDPVDWDAEDVLCSMIAALDWDARVFGLCRLADLEAARAENIRRPGVRAAATFWMHGWEHDFAAYNVHKNILSWRKELMPFINLALHDMRLAGDAAIVLIAGPAEGETENPPGGPLRGDWIFIHFPRIVGRLRPTGLRSQPE